jgi:DNA-binding transcriptional MocR family regulator
VIRWGNFSKTLAPVLNPGFPFIPASVVLAFIRACAPAHGGIDAFNQATLCIKAGGFRAALGETGLSSC